MTEENKLFETPEAPILETEEEQEHFQITDNAVEKNQEQSFEEQGERILLEASRELGDILETERVIRAEMEATSDEKEESQLLSQKAEHLFSDFYRRAKKAARLLPLLFVLSESGDISNSVPQNELHEKDIQRVETQARKEKGYLIREDLPFKAAFADWWVSGEFLEMYNKFVALSEERNEGKMTQEEIEFRENIAQNMYPYRYGGDVSGSELPTSLAPDVNAGYVVDVKDSDIPAKQMAEEPLEKFRQISENKRFFQKENIEKIQSPRLCVRIDLFRKYLGLPQYFDSIEKSAYTPTIAQNPDAIYFSFNPNRLVESLKKTEKANTFKDLEEYISKGGPLPHNEFTDQLGRYISGTGYDEKRKEKYVSYYDVWDIDPPILQETGIDIDKFNFPFEVYGRIYESDFI